nr:immunoglobulin heavy chain junction region [Macaca mulatta]MOX65403.1 immunoglobulin heavy chain junction region [Macaca mulatta]MOX67629.1 immunoglobulin heavy chain junction region [Macaca mulatta]MOX68302.1 immunoglobulin heavy chain junction region [Macaca mulatta]
CATVSSGNYYFLHFEYW